MRLKLLRQPMRLHHMTNKMTSHLISHMMIKLTNQMSSQSLTNHRMRKMKSVLKMTPEKSKKRKNLNKAPREIW